MIQAYDKPILQSAARGWKRSKLGVIGVDIRSFNATPGIGNRPIVEMYNCGRKYYLGEFDTQEQADNYAEECRKYVCRCFDRA